MRPVLLASMLIKENTMMPHVHNIISTICVTTRFLVKWVTETWIQFAEGYYVSDKGNVRSRRGVLVHLLDSRHEPYHKIRGKWYRVKRLVAEHFLPNPDHRRRVRHINGNTLDCRLSNLEWY